MIKKLNRCILYSKEFKYLYIFIIINYSTILNLISIIHHLAYINIKIIYNKFIN